MKRRHICQEQAEPEVFEQFAEQQQQAISILGASGYQHGVEVVEAWGNVEKFDVHYMRAVNDKVMGIDGQPFFRVHSTIASREISMSGETNAALTMFSLSTVTVVANDVADIGSAAGSIFFDDATVSQQRTGQRSIDAKLSSDPTITAT